MKSTLRRLFSKYAARWALGLLLTLAALAQVQGTLQAPLMDRLDVWLYDLRLGAGTPALDPRIVIVDIDERSLTEIGRFPWSRDIVADMVTKLTETYKVKAIGFDILFAEADNSSGYATLAALAGNEMRDVPQFRQRVDALQSRLDFDGRLAKSLTGKPVALGYFLYDQQPSGLLPAPAFSETALKGRQLDTRDWKSYRGNIASLQGASRGAGFFNATLDTDGMIRSTPLLARIGNDYHESLGLATARIALGATAIRPVFVDDANMLASQQQNYIALDSIELNSLPHPTNIPVDRDLASLIEYRGAGGPSGGGFRYLSAADVIKGRIDPRLLDQRIVLIGTTAAGLNDFRSTPVNKEYPGVEIHANVIASILDGRFLHRPDWSLGYDMLQILIVGGLLSLLLPAMAPALAILSSTCAIAAVTALNLWAYQSAQAVLPLATVLLLIFAIFLINLGWGYLFEYRKSRAMVNLFGEYVAPELVAEMAENPENYNMQGESRELTVLFADVRGFTTISESLAPGPLREYINLYLTAMSENIRGNRGTLDKYIGDAVMAFWGAPVHLPNHARLAVATALQMQASAAKLNDDFVARGLPALKIGIGLNSGEMRVGDMGSKVRRAYTVMGDAVNLSSRLEGITKHYGVGIVVGEATTRLAPEYVYRELDRVRVKGKDEAVPIFEPLGMTDSLTPQQLAALEDWSGALALFRLQQWEDAGAEITKLRDADPDARLYTLYLERIKYYGEHPPGSTWDGAWTYDTK